MIDVCFTHFKSLSLANLEAALYSLRQQDFSRVAALYVLDNDSPDSERDIRGLLNDFAFPVPVTLEVAKHGDPSRTHAWSTNTVVRLGRAPWIFFSRADYILDFDILQRYAARRGLYADCFVTGDVYHLHVDIATCESVAWRGDARRLLSRPGSHETYTVIDSGVWLASRSAFARVGGLDERLTAWGHAQTHFQWKLAQQGTHFVRIPEVLFYHPAHGGEKDIREAHAQLASIGVDLREMWARYDGESPYG